MVAFIIIILITICLTTFLWKTRPPVEKKTFKIAKAGKVNRYSPLTIEMNNLFNKKYVSEGNVIDPNDYEIFIVDGDSMSKNGVNSGDAVFIKKLYANEKLQINDHPILMFEINQEKDIHCHNDCQQQIEFKLRKFIGYIQTDNTFEASFHALVSKHKVLPEDRQAIEEKYEDCLIQFTQHNSKQTDPLLTMSSSYDSEKDCFTYSFHPIKFLYGKVAYIVPADKIK